MSALFPSLEFRCESLAGEVELERWVVQDGQSQRELHSWAEFPKGGDKPIWHRLAEGEAPPPGVFRWRAKGDSAWHRPGAGPGSGGR